MQSARKRLWIVDSLAGVAAQFQHRKDGYVYQEGRIGAPIPVSREEYDAFLGDAAQALLLHIAGFCISMVAIWLAVRRMMPGDAVLAAGLITFLGCAAAMLLYVSYRWAALAPARALAGRPAIGPASAPALSKHASYPAMFGAAAIFIICLLLGDRARAETAVLAVLIIMGALFMAGRKWRFEHRLAPAQRAELKADRVAERARECAQFRPGQALILLLFGIVELAVFAAVGYTTITLVLGATGSSSSDPDGWSLALGLIVGCAVAALAVSPLEALCKRLTGMKPSAAFEFLLYLP